MVVRERGVWVSVVLVACGLFLLAGPALAGGACPGQVDGAVRGEFGCSLDASYREKKDVTTLVIGVPQPPAGVQSLAPCSYDLQGKNIEGPPPRPLETFRVDLAGDDVYVTRGA